MVDQSIYRFKVGAIECIALLEGIVEDPVNVLMENVNLDTVGPELARYGLKKDFVDFLAMLIISYLDFVS